MGGATCEEGLLKLVHRGRYVEILKEPITAAEVMEKNPRHCITRPDFFKYPWIVVKPESVLNLGRVFFIVPNHTVRHLMKTRGSSDQLSMQSQSPFLNGTSPLKSYAGMTPKHLKNNQSLQRLSRAICWPEASPQEQKSGGRFRKQSKVETWPGPIVKHKRISLEHEENSADRIRLFNARDYYYYYSTDSSISLKFSEREDKIIVFDRQQSKEFTISKSCLRKEDSVRKSRHLRVSFALPMKDDDRELQNRDTEFSGFSIC